VSEIKIPSSPPLFPHRRGMYGKGYQKCVSYVGLDYNDNYFGQGFPLCAVIKFKRPIYRYTPRTSEIAKLLATLRILYGDAYMEELNTLAEEEYEKLRRDLKWLITSGDDSD